MKVLFCLLFHYVMLTMMVVPMNTEKYYAIVNDFDDYGKYDDDEDDEDD